MDSLTDDQNRIDRELVGPAVTVGGHLIQPVARMTGRARGTGGGVKITPVRMVVVDPQGQDQTVPIFDLTGQTVRAIAGTGLALAAACGLIILLRQALRGAC